MAARAALAPLTVASPSLLAATSSDKMSREARAQLATKVSKMSTISSSTHLQHAQPSRKVKIEACGTTKRQRAHKG